MYWTLKPTFEVFPFAVLAQDLQKKFSLESLQAKAQKIHNMASWQQAVFFVITSHVSNENPRAKPSGL